MSARFHPYLCGRNAAEWLIDMKYFTKFLSLFFAAAMLLTMAACGSKNTDTDTDTKTGSEKKQLVVATSPDFPPFESLDGSDIVGIEPKLMQAIADKLGMELVWEQVDFDSIIPGIQAGRYDAGVAGISITADRLKNCDFSDPYFLANQVIVVNPGSDNQSKADAWVVDNEVAVKMAGEQNLTVLDEAMTSEPYALAFAKGSDLVDQVNQALSQLLQDGTVEQIFQEYDTVYVSPLS